MFFWTNKKELDAVENRRWVPAFKKIRKTTYSHFTMDKCEATVWKQIESSGRTVTISDKNKLYECREGGEIIFIPEGDLQFPRVC